MTTDTATLTEWLLERIAADEAVALAAMVETRVESHATSTLVDGHYVRTRNEREVVDDGVWSTGDHSMDECVVTGIGITIYDEGGHTAEQARHIARNDPSRILATCKAHRAIVELAAEATGLDLQVEGEFGVGRRDPVDDPYLGDQMLKALAAIYAGEPGFREEWV